MNFGTRLKELRLEFGLKQEELATPLGLKRPAISKYENSTLQPDIDRLVIIADFFNTSIDYLLGRTNERNTNFAKESTATALLSAQQQRLNEVYKRLNEMNKVIVLERAETLLEMQQREKESSAHIEGAS